MTEVCLHCLGMGVLGDEECGAGVSEVVRKAALNAFAITFDGRILPTEH